MKYYEANNDLPGPKFKTTGQTSFHRPQHFSVECKVTRLDPAKGGIGGAQLSYRPRDEFEISGQTGARIGWSVPKESRGLEPPNWIRKDKQVLRFYSYFKDRVEDQGVERERIRKCVIHFFLEDDTLKVMEPHDKNSGIVQGTLVSRHRIPFSYPQVSNDDDEPVGPWSRTYPEPYITLWDLNVRKNIIIYGRTHRIYDCDAFSKSLLERLGIGVPPAEPVPADFFSEQRALVETTRPLRPYKRVQSAKTLGQMEGRILRFYAQWTDETALTPEVRHFCIHFYREDETIEVVENHHVNCGRYKAPIFLKRCRIPKSVQELVSLPGTKTDHTLLNVVRSRGPGRIRDAILIDNLETRTDKDPFSTSFYHEQDFEIGKTVQIGGRSFNIYDCDEFTRSYFQDQYNMKMEPLELPKVVEKPIPKASAPYTGFGTEEDSLTSCNGLEPRAPQRDFDKFVKFDRVGYDSHILRFSARLIENDKIDTKRKFVISYFLVDDTILITQLTDMNSGRDGGRFLAKTKVKKPKALWRDPEASEPDYYTVQDLYVGAIVDLNSHAFLLTEADDYVLSFMEKEASRDSYPYSNIRLILAKLNNHVDEDGVKHLMGKFMGFDPDDMGAISENNFRSVLRDFFGFNLNEHEIITLVRHFRSRDERHQRLPRHLLVSLLQAELKKINFSTFAEVLKTFQAKDVVASGTLPKDVVRHTLVSSCGNPRRSQLKTFAIRDLIDSYLESFADDMIDYEGLLHEVDWQRNAVRPVPPQVVPTTFYSYPLQNQMAPILYRDLVSDLEDKKRMDTLRDIEKAKDKLAKDKKEENVEQ